jgi:hypothetical protein
VREAEKLVSNFHLLKEEEGSELTGHVNTKHWSELLSQVFSTKVNVKLNSRGSGKIVIHVDSPEEINWIIDHIKLEK